MKNDSVVQRSCEVGVRLLPLAAALISVFAAVSSPCFAQVQKGGGVVDESGQLWVGRRQGGSLLIQGGATHTSDTAWIGEQPRSDGEVRVSGPGSTWTISDQLYVSVVGIGTLTIDEGGTVYSSGGWIGGHTGRWGSALDSVQILAEEGAQKLLHPFGGDSDSNSPKSGSGAGLAIPAVPEIGAELLGKGTVRVSGTGSVWTNSHTLTLGASGNGSLVIADGGRVSVHDGAGTVGLATVLTASGTIHIGAESHDPNKATGAGVLEAATIAFGTGVGTLNFNHIDSNYDFGTALTSTGSGTQKLNHYAGVTRLTGDSSNFLGDTTVSGGTLAVSGKLGWAKPVSFIGFPVGKNLAGSVTVEQTGRLVIKDGGNVFSSDGWIGAHEGSSGTVAGLVEEKIETLVGHTLPGVLKSAGTGGQSEVVVSGTGSAWENSGTLTVGSSGNGSLVIAEGGRVSVRDGAGTVGVATLGGGGDGTIYIGAKSLDPNEATGAGSLEAQMVAFGGGRAHCTSTITIVTMSSAPR